MGAFQPLFSLEVEHSYFPGGVCRGLKLTPTPATQRLIGRAGGLLRHTDRGLFVACDVNMSLALGRLAEQSELVFHFRGHGPDARFANYTEGDFGSQQSLRVFHTQGTARGDDGRWRLKADTLPLDAPEFDGVLSAQGRRVPPHFIVRLSLDAEALDVPRRYVCRLEARATVWKYCLFGELAEEPDALQVVDLGQSLRFGPPVDERLPDGRPMLVVRSAEPITLQERSSQRFQLRRAGAAGADKVLVKRLPVASPSQLNRETLGGVPTWVSEIYVHPSLSTV